MDPKNAQGNDNSDNSDSVAVDEQIKDFVMKTANAAASAQSTRVTKALKKEMADFGEQLKAQIIESITTAKAPTNPEGDKEGGDKDKGAVDDKLKAAELRYESRVKELSQRLEAEAKAREEEHAKSQRTEERSKLTEALRDSGAANIKGAIALLYDSDKRIARSDDGHIVFKFQRDGYTDELPLSEGVQEWLNTDEGKHYLPPRPAAGSGNKGGSIPNLKNGQKLSRSEKLALLGSVLAKGKAA